MAKAKRTKSASDRAQESRAAKIAAGYAAKSYLLPPQAIKDLARITERDGCSEVEAVESALAVLAASNREPSNAQLAALVTRRLKGLKE